MCVIRDKLARDRQRGPELFDEFRIEASQIADEFVQLRCVDEWLSHRSVVFARQLLNEVPELSFSQSIDIPRIYSVEVGEGSEDSWVSFSESGPFPSSSSSPKGSST